MYQAKKNKINGTNTCKLSKEILELTYKFMLLGANDKQLADALNVSEATIYYWKQQKPEFAKVVKDGKLKADAEVAYSLHGKAIGFEREEIQVIANQVKIYSEETGKLIKSYTEPLFVPVMKYYPPDSYAANKWISLRQRELWNDVTQININHSGSVNLNYLQQVENPEMITDNDLELALSIGMQKALAKNAEANN